MDIASEEILTKYFELLGSNLSTGVDKITYTKFLNEKENEINLISKKINSKSYEFSRFKDIKLNTGRCISIPTIRDRLTLEVLKNSLSRKFRVKFSHRDDLINVLIHKFSSDSKFHVFRLDIKSFFSSIPHNKLLQKVKNTSMLSLVEYKLLKSVINKNGIGKGLPQGVSISNILSEVYMEHIDDDLKKIHPQINHVQRYVDDILIILNGHLQNHEVKNIEIKLNRMFKEIGLTLNEEKFQIRKLYKRENIGEFDYLGYNFSFKNKELYLSISTNKVEKINETILKVFNEYSKVHKNVNLLIEQIKYLTSKKTSFKIFSYIDKDNDINIRNRKIYYGIIESYKHVNNDNKQWEKFDILLSNLIHVHTNLIKASNKDRRKLYSIKFQKSVASNITYRLYKFNRNELESKILMLDNTKSPGYYRNYDRNKLFKEYFRLVDI